MAALAENSPKVRQRPASFRLGFYLHRRSNGFACPALGLDKTAKDDEQSRPVFQRPAQLDSLHTIAVNPRALLEIPRAKLKLAGLSCGHANHVGESGEPLLAEDPLAAPVSLGVTDK